MDGLNSSKPIQTEKSLRSYYGFGLLITRRLIEENRGQMYLVSGGEGLHIDRYHRQHYPLNGKYHGTFVALVLDLANPLPLEEIYDEEMGEYTGLQPESASSARKAAKKLGAPTNKGNHGSPAAPLPATEQSGVTEKAAAQPQAEATASEGEVRTSDGAKRIELRHYGTELLTRDAGTAIRADIAGYLAAGYVVQVSLDEVTDMTPSVADEAFGKLAELLGYEAFERRVQISGGTQIANRLVSFVLKTRKVRGTER